MKILVAITGGSGYPLAIRLLEELGKKGIERHLVMSRNAEKVREYECEGTTPEYEKKYEPESIHEKICSGSYPIDAMIVIPCSMNTLAKIASGIEDNAITRAAGVNLKQERRVILVPRETPMNLAHLRNLVKAKEQGCSIVPPMLTHYTKPKTIEDMENQIIGRILQLLNIKNTLYTEWSGKNEP